VILEILVTTLKALSKNTNYQKDGTHRNHSKKWNSTIYKIWGEFVEK
jgi:hypothetical protein